jgi:hypothetical protein
MFKSSTKILLALVVLVVGANAQNSPSPTPTPVALPAENADASAVILSPHKDFALEQPVDSDGTTRTVSPGIAAALSEGMPKYRQVTPTPTPAAEPVDQQDIDHPKNEIKRLPKFVVRESRPPVFRDRDLFSAEELANISIKNHAGLLFGNFLGLNSAPAYEMYLDDQRKADMDDLSDLSHAMSRGGDASEGSYILQESQDTYMRHNDDWNWTGPGAGGGNTGGWGK